MGRENRAVDPFDVPQEADLEDLLRSLARAWKVKIRTHVPASVVAFDAATETATVQVQILPVVKVTDEIRLAKLAPRAIEVRGTPPNAEAVLQPIQLVKIPVAFYGTATAYLSVPILPGTTGLLHIADRALEKWSLGGIPTDPVLAFTHALKDSVFAPGLKPTTTPRLQPIDLTAAVLEGPLVKLGRLATEAAVKSPSLVTALVNAVNASAVGSMDGGATFKANLAAQLALIGASISSTKVQVE